MKKLLVAVGIAAMCFQAFADTRVIVCETDRKGKVCCWDSNVYGPNRPWTCN